MLTLEETRWSLNAFKAFSILNIFPIQVDVKSGKIQRQSNKVKVFIWKFLFGVGVSHWCYMFVRLVQSTILEPEKYFRWDHFVLHFGLTCCSAVNYFTGFRLFVQNPEENVVIFNQLFEEREDPVQKMMEQSTQVGMQNKVESGNGTRGNETGGKPRARLMLMSAREPNEHGQKEVIENQLESKAHAPARPLLTWPPQYSLDELVAMLIPVSAVSTAFCIMLILAVDPSRLQLLFSVLPPEWQNVWSFLILLAVETICMNIVFFTASFALVTQVLFFGKVQLEFQRMSLQLRNLEKKFQNRSLGMGIEGREIEREIWILRQILEEMRELVVLIELFNRCFPWCIFAWKIYSLSISIICYFFVIRHFEDFPLFALFTGYIAIAITLIYSIMYQNAFPIPGKMDELKNQFLLTAQKTTRASTANANSNSNVHKSLRAEMKREIRRIRGVGIKVGSFNQLERESTPKFIDFVLGNVVSLLVTFPR